MKTSFLASAIALAVAAPALAVNLVSDPSFEAGGIGWTFNGFAVSSVIGGVGPFSGNLFASNVCVGVPCTLSQTVATTAGGIYTIDFHFNPGLFVTSSGGSLTVFWDGSQIGPDIGIGPLGYANHAYRVTATTASTLLEFRGVQIPAASGLDDVSVTAYVPEPASWALMVAGFGLVGAVLRRRSAEPTPI